MKKKNEVRENLVGVLAAYAAWRADGVDVVEPTVERPSAAQMPHGQYRDAVRKAEVVRRMYSRVTADDDVAVAFADCRI